MAWSTVHENGLPVNIQTGREYNDCNGDRTVEVLMEYDESDKMLVMGALNATINEWAGLVWFETEQIWNRQPRPNLNIGSGYMASN